MKKLLSYTLVMIISLGSTFAQKKIFDKEYYIGFNGGGMSSSIDFQPSKSQITNLGIQGGVTAKVITENHLGLQLEVNYSQKGWSEEFEPESDYEYTRTLHYVEMPFMTHIYFGNKTRFVINAGPQIGYMFGDATSMSNSFKKYLEDMTAISPDEPAIAQYNSQLKRFDYGIAGGAGMELKTGIGNLQLEGRYYFGLGDIFENRKSKNNIFNRSANRNIIVKLTYFFQVK